MLDSGGVPIKNGSLVRIDGTIVKTAKIVLPDAEGITARMCVTNDGLDIPFVCGFGRWVPIDDVMLSHRVDVIT